MGRSLLVNARAHIAHVQFAKTLEGGAPYHAQGAWSKNFVRASRAFVYLSTPIAKILGSPLTCNSSQKKYILKFLHCQRCTCRLQLPEVTVLNHHFLYIIKINLNVCYSRVAMPLSVIKPRSIVNNEPVNSRVILASSDIIVKLVTVESVTCLGFFKI